MSLSGRTWTRIDLHCFCTRIALNTLATLSRCGRHWMPFLRPILLWVLGLYVILKCLCLAHATTQLGESIINTIILFVLHRLARCCRARLLPLLFAGISTHRQRDLHRPVKCDRFVARLRPRRIASVASAWLRLTSSCGIHPQLTWSTTLSHSVRSRRFEKG